MVVFSSELTTHYANSPGENSHPGQRDMAFLQSRDTGSVIFPAFFTQSELKEMLEKIYALKPEWQQGAGPGDYTIGNVWYAYIAFEKVADYFGQAGQSRAYIETHFPGLEKRIVDFCSQLVGEPARIRPGWGGPAFVNFTHDSETATESGQLHIDHDGLPDGLLMTPDADNNAFSFIIPLQLPNEGGNLFVWPDIFDRANWRKYMCDSFSDMGEPCGHPHEIFHKVGNLVGIKSLRVHQIGRFSGQVDRITLNFRLTRIDKTWNIWF